MVKNNSSNNDFTNNADGFDVSGGTTKRKLAVTGADITLTGSGTAVITLPATTCSFAAPGTSGNVMKSDGTNWTSGVPVVTNLSNPYKFLVYRNAALNTPNNTWAKYNMDSESYDTNNNFASGTYTVPVTGFYYVYMRLEAAANAVTIVPGVYKTNGGNTPLLYGSYASTIAQAVVCNGLLSLTAGDTIEPWCYCSSAVASSTGANVAYFGAYLMCAT